MPGPAFIGIDTGQQIILKPIPAKSWLDRLRAFLEAVTLRLALLAIGFWLGWLVFG